jgi:hypothetical protein
MMVSTEANITRLPERSVSHQYSGGRVSREISGAGGQWAKEMRI